MAKTKRPMSINVNGDKLGDTASRQKFYRTIERLRPDGIFVLNNLGVALDMKDLVNNEGDVIFRDYDPFGDNATVSFDNAFHQIHRDPRQVLDRLEQKYGQYRDRLVFAYGYNEPSHNPADPNNDLEQMTDWFIQLADEAYNRGIRLSIGEIAVDKTIKAFSVHDVQNGRWDDYLRMLDAHRGWHIPTFHTYISYFTPADLLISRGADPLDANTLHPSQWVKEKLATERVQWQGGFVMPPHYHIGRELLITHLRAEEIGLQPIDYWITECFIDEKHDMLRYEEVKRRFDSPPYSPMRGVMGHRPFWAWVMGKNANSFTDDEFADLTFQNFEWLADALPDECRVLNPFTASVGTEWDIPGGFNLWDGRFDLYWERCIAYNNWRESLVPNESGGGETPPVIIVEPRVPNINHSNWMFGEVRINHNRGFTNVRRQPKLGDNKLPKLAITEDWTPALWNMDEEVIVRDEGNDIVWIPMIRNDIKCWSSANHFMTRNGEHLYVEPPPSMSNIRQLVIAILVALSALLAALGITGINITFDDVPDPTPTQEILNP